MVKSLVKPLIINEKNLINYTSNTPKEYNSPKKSRQEINRENYQKNKERIKKRQQERYQNIRMEAIKGTTESEKKYSDASDIKILMSLKKYTELNPQKRENWLKFIWTFRDLADNNEVEVKNIAVSDIIQVMKLREDAENLINDYWETAKAESKRGKDWNDLDQEQKDRLIKYFGRKKARWEASLEAKLTDEEERGKLWEKELYQMIEVVKHHEERGKKDCSCWSCKVHKEVQQEIKAKEKKKLKEWGEEQDRQRGLKDEGAEEWTQSECANCYEYKKVSVESGLCRKCEKEADEGYGED